MVAREEQRHIEVASTDKQKDHSCKEIKLEERLANQRKRKSSGININDCEKEEIAVPKHLKTSNKNDMKCLEANKQFHTKDKNTPDQTKLPLLFQHVSDFNTKTVDNSDSPQCNVMSSKHYSEGLFDQTDSQREMCKNKTNKIIQSSPTAHERKDTGTLIPYNGDIHTTENIKLPMVHGRQGTSDAGISFNDDLHLQEATRVTSAGFHQGSKFKNTFIGEDITKSKDISSADLVDMDIDYWLSLEGLLEVELERAQELRYKCALEEMRTRKAYQKAQRALVDANSKCSLLYGKRECISAKVQAHMMESSTSLWPTCWSNKDENISDILKDIAGADGLLCNVKNKMNSAHNLEAIANVSDAPATNDVACNSISQRVKEQSLVKNHYIEPDEQASHSNSADAQNDQCHNISVADQQKHALNSIPKNGGICGNRNVDDKSEAKCIKLQVSTTEAECVNVHVSKSETSANIQGYELEASLRSKLVARFGLKGFAKGNKGNIEATNDAGKVLPSAAKEVKNIDVHDRKQYSFSHILLPEDGTKKSADIESRGITQAHGQLEDDVISLHAEPRLNTNFHERGILQVSISSFPCSIHILSKNGNFIGPELNMSTEKAFTERYGSIFCAEDDITKHNSILSKLINIDSYISHIPIDPFWPFCMFELRGKCNDEECSWQHLIHRKCTNMKHFGDSTINSDSEHGSLSSFKKCNDAPRSSHRYLNTLPIPTYLIGSNIVKSDTQSSGSLLARSNWQYQQSSFCTRFSLPLPIERIIPRDAPNLHVWRCHGFDESSSKMLLSFLQNEDKTGKHFFHGLTGSEQSLELAIDLFNMKDSKMLGRKKSLFILSRALEENPDNVLFWVVYLHIFYRKEKDVGNDDMFSHAVKHNERSYEIWLMYINSRMQFELRINAYSDALSALCHGKITDSMDGDYCSSCILDLFLQMLDLLCMNGKVEKAVSTIHGLLKVSMEETSVDSMVLQCLTISDRCIFCICCIYVVLYGKLPEVVIQQFELVKELPFGIEWPPIRLSNIKKDGVVALMKVALDKVDINFVDSTSGKECFQKTTLRSAHFLAVSHVKFSMVVEDFNCTSDLLVRYVSNYPTCIELVKLSAHYWKLLKNEPKFEIFEQALHNWPKQVHGIQCLWNQYAAYAMHCNCFDTATDIFVRWFNFFCKFTDTQIKDDKKESKNILSSTTELPCMSFANGDGHHDPDDRTYGLLNLFLYAVMQKDMVKAQLAIDEALKYAENGCFKHCVREYLAFLFPNGILSHKIRALSLLSSYIGDTRSSSVLQPLNRMIFENIKKPRVRNLITTLTGPVSRDCSLLNSVLEDCYGPLLLPEVFDEPKELGECAEYLMEISPANYRLAISVHRVASRNFGQSGISSTSILFWASSLLVNCIFQCLPVAPEQAWVEAASLLNVLDVRDITERFHQQGLIVYPFSVKLWKSYYDLSKIMGNAHLIVASAREKGVELG